MPHTVSYFFSLDHGKNYSQRIISLKTFIYCTCAQLYFQLKKLKIKGRRRRGLERMRWLDGINDY